VGSRAVATGVDGRATSRQDLRQWREGRDA
jgi:hypothetical protein